MKGNLPHVVVSRQRRPGIPLNAGHDVHHTVWNHVSGHFHQLQYRKRRLLSRLEDGCVARRQCRSELPGGHQQREVPWDDLPDNAVRFLQCLNLTAIVSFDSHSLVCAGRTGEVPEVIDDQFDIDPSLCDRFAVVE